MEVSMVLQTNSLNKSGENSKQITKIDTQNMAGVEKRFKTISTQWNSEGLNLTLQNAPEP